MPRAITADDLWALARVGQPEPLPDGSAAVVPVTTHDLGANGATTQLYLAATDGGLVRLTAGESSAQHPRLDAAGERVAFLRPPAGSVDPQLWVMGLYGGEARVLTDFPLGAGPARWLPDGSGLVVAVPLLRGFPSLAATRDEIGRRAAAASSPIATEDRIYRHWKRWLTNGRIHHLFRLDVATGQVHDLTPGWDRLLSTEPEPIGAFDISPDGSTVAVTADVAPEPQQRFQFAVHLVPTGGGEPTLATPGEPPAHQRRPRFSPDGAQLLYGVQNDQDYYADPVRLTILHLDTGVATELASTWDRSAAGWEFADDHSIVLHAEDEGRLRLFRLSRDSATPRAIEAPGSWHGPQPANGVLWCRQESAVAPPDIAIVDDDGPRVVGRWNETLLAGIELGTVSEIEITGSDDQPIHVRVVYPPDFDPDRTWPLVHNIHGGPHGLVADTWHWRWNTQVLSSPGYVVASVNFHGSTSWGDDFARSIRGAWGDKPARDILAATDHLVGLGFIDEARMAVAGGSYGGYLATWLTGVTGRFAASVCHAGVTDLLGQWASDVTAGREHAIGGLPWEDMDAVQAWSPLAHTRDITTPTLVLHGELDYRVVVTQGLALYGILKHKGVPARLVYYPDEGHWIETPQNSLHWYGEVLDWLERWIGK